MVTIKKSNTNEKQTDPIERIKNWCAYQERSAYETRIKLKTYGLNAESIDLVIAELISENFLNEERFAKAFVRGKFSIKHWGIQKIKQALKFHHISEYSVKKALAQIDTSNYAEELKKIVEKKLATLKKESPLQQKQKLYRYALSKGYESQYIEIVLQEILTNT